MRQDTWLTAHPYLLSVAQFHAQVEKASACLPSALACMPNWSDYKSDYLAGVPVLRSPGSTIDLKPVEIALEVLLQKLSSAPLPFEIAHNIKDLDVKFRKDPSFSSHAVTSLFDPSSGASMDWGLLQYLGWTVMAHYLSKVVDAFGKWRDEERWLRRYCPTCGSLPAMAQLVGIDPARLRFLSCGCCGTRWQYRRTGCPFCDNKDDHRLAILVVEGESELRIDHCESCGGYIKTYNGSGDESLFLADWTSLHLDIIARDQGLNRSAVSLFEV